jgi:tetratricopeptide (TPR) repeat protein
LIQQTLNEELTTGRRLQLHSKIVGAVEELYADHIHEHYPELLHHAQEAETILGSDITANYALLSGEQALNSYAWSDAESKFKVAYDALGSKTASATYARILFGLGKVELQTLTYPDIKRGWDKVAEAFHLFDQMGDVDSAVQVAVRSKGFIPFWLHSTMPVFSRALELAQPESTEAGTLFNLLGAAARYEEEDSEKAEDALRRALEIAKQTGDRQLETGTLAELSMGALSEGESQLAVDMASQAIDLASKHNFPLIEMYAHFISSAAHEGVGNAEKASFHAEAERAIEQRTGSVVGGAWNRLHVAYGQGDREEIEQLGDLIDSQYPTDRVVRLFVGIGDWNIGKDSNLQDRITTAQDAGRTAPNLFQK